MSTGRLVDRLDRAAFQFSRTVDLPSLAPVLVLPVILLVFASACASSREVPVSESAGTGDRQDATTLLRVVSTVSPITSIVENIGGDRINLQGIVPEGVNSHTFEPVPSLAAILSKADLVFLNGPVSGRANQGDGGSKPETGSVHSEPGRPGNQQGGVAVRFLFSGGRRASQPPPMA